METRVSKLLGTKYPVIQGGMAWVAEYHLAAAVSNAGGLGIIGAASAPPEVVREQIREAKKLTDKPFGVNVMLLNPNAAEVAQIVIEEGVKVVTTGAGNPGKFMDAWKQAGVVVIPVVASVAMARMMERGGADAVIAEGMESGGHIGAQTTMTLVPQVADAGHCRRGNCRRQRHGSSIYARRRRCTDGNQICGRERIHRASELQGACHQGKRH